MKISNRVNEQSCVYAVSATDITLSRPATALCVSYSAEQEINLPTADGENIAGFLFKDVETGERAAVARREVFAVPVGEAISAVNTDLMCEASTGRVKILTSGSGYYKVGRSLLDRGGIGENIICIIKGICIDGEITNYPCCDDDQSSEDNPHTFSIDPLLLRR